jgi:histidinol-phosphate aminotransferase
MSEAAKQAIVDSLDVAFRYPDGPRAALISKIAQDNGVSENQVSLGNGSSENIRTVVQMLLDKSLIAGQALQVVVPDPTFAYGEMYATFSGLPVVKVPLTAENYDLDLPALQQAAADFEGMTLFYLCNPNNPTGTITAADAFKAWVINAPEHHYFILDEAYSEYVTDPSFESGIEWIKQDLSRNIVVVRTFSKLCALAGMRVGYAIANPEMIAQIESFASMDNTNLSGAVAALATLNDTAYLDLSLRTTNKSRQMVESVLEELGLRYLPSQTNFIFHEIKGDVQTYIDRMREHGVLVGRVFPPVTNGFNRVTLGTPEEMAIFIKVLRSFREKGWV